MDRYAVIGNPVSHSKSPVIHAEFARQTRQQLEYTRLEAPLDGFVETVREFEATGGRGLNVTVPFKEQAWRLCDELSEYASSAAAVNTLSFRDGKIVGANTDGIGLVRDITVNLGFSLANRNILILGAGGAVKGVLRPFLDESPGSIWVANRTVEKALQLADEYDDRVSGGGYEAIPDQVFDLIVNGTAASLQGQLPPLSAKSGQNASCCYDMMYGSGDTAFVAWARQQGVAVAVDGLGMLVEQAAESFFIWRGVRPDTRPVLDMLRQG